jgi:pimeloyl-ACP methyl ester carboxylesterase
MPQDGYVHVQGVEKTASCHGEQLNQPNPATKGGSRATIREASHGLEYENPKAFNEIVLSFLEKH